MDCGRVLLTVDDGCLPSATTSTAKAPASATKVRVGQFSKAARAGTFADSNTSQSSGAIEHAFAKCYRSECGSAILQPEAKISEVGRTDPLAEVGRASRDLQSVGTRF